MGYSHYGIHCYICIYVAHHFILLQLNRLGLTADREGWWFELYVTAAICLSAERAKNVSWPSLSALWRWGSLTMAFTGKLVYMWLTISSCYGSITLPLGLMGRDTGLSTLCHSCRFACQQKVKINVSLPWRFALRGWGSLTMAFTDKFLYIGLTISSSYSPFGLRVDREGWWFEQSVS